MTIFLLYLWLKLDTISAIFGWSSFFILVAMAFAIGGATINWVDSTNYGKSKEDVAEALRLRDYWYKRAKIFVPIGVFLAFMSHMIPSQREGAYLIAGYAGLKLAETPEMSKLTEVVRLKVGNYLDDELNAARAEAAKKIKDAASAAVSK